MRLMMARLLLPLLLLLALAPALASPGPVLLAGDVAPVYHPGEKAAVALRLVAEDGAALPDEAVLFLNVVIPDPERGWPQMAHRLFATAELAGDGDMFGEVLDAAALREGRSAVLHVRFKEHAPPGDYEVVLQLFRGPNTNPHRVRVEDRVAIRSFPFRVEPRPAAETR